MARIVLASSNENDVIFDPFAGAGTSLIVCELLRRNFFAIENNPEHVAYGNSVLSALRESDPVKIRETKKLELPAHIAESFYCAENFSKDNSASA